MSKESVLLKILVLGDTRVGKTSFLKTYSTGECPKEYKRTFGVDFVSAHLNLAENFDVNLHFWDLSGYLQKDQLSTYFRDAHGAIIIFDERSESKANIVKWKELLDEKATFNGIRRSPPIILVHNKVDLICSRSSEYPREELTAIAAQFGFIASYPCSTIHNWNIKPIVAKLVKETVHELKTKHNPSAFDENEEVWAFMETSSTEEGSRCTVQ